MKKIIVLLALITLISCSGLVNNFKQPSVSVNDFKMLPLSGFTPEFEVGLNVKNPNKIPIILKGLSYSIILNDEEVVSGVSTSLPMIAALGEENITVNAKPDFSSSFSLIKQLISKQSDLINYKLQLHLDLGPLHPGIDIDRHGKFSLLDLKQLNKII